MIHLIYTKAAQIHTFPSPFETAEEALRTFARDILAEDVTSAHGEADGEVLWLWSRCEA